MAIDVGSVTNFPGGSHLLVGVDGNAFSIMGFVTGRLRAARNDIRAREQYREQAIAGDYDHLLAVSCAFMDACRPDGYEDDFDGSEEDEWAWDSAD